MRVSFSSFVEGSSSRASHVESLITSHDMSSCSNKASPRGNVTGRPGLKRTNVVKGSSISIAESPGPQNATSSIYGKVL